jgi:uncharacterized protein (TIGR02284 family)
MLKMFETWLMRESRTRGMRLQRGDHSRRKERFDMSTDTTKHLAEDHGESYDAVNDLIQVDTDAAEGFEKAADALNDPAHKMVFKRYAGERRKFATQLVTASQPYYGSVDTNGSVAAGLHRAWISVKDALTSGDHAILAAAESGEDHAVETYQAALERDLPRDLRRIVERQYADVKQAHDHVRTMRDTAA